MSLTSGTKIGPYEIVGAIGAGGMGEVYRAKDAKLGRDVAIKIVPEQFAQDRQRMARFEREAQLLAALNHPHIAHIYGFEDSNGTPALVMELVEGPTLAERIEQGPLPVEESLRIARQVAEALEYAHDRGIIHRDLKPANVKLTADGNVKILDFGLAKALEDERSTTDISHSPTLTVAATQAGIVLGTAAYMSPEQAKGKNADRRADIWSFGVLLYEMLSGKKLYDADTAQETLAAVLIKEPSLDSLPANISPRLRLLLRRCLTKDSRMRLQAIGEARIAIDEIISGPGQEETPGANAPVAARGKNRERIAWGIAGLLTLIATALTIGLVRRAPQPAQPIRLSADLGADTTFGGTISGANAILSPDGTRLVFIGQGSDKKAHIYVRPLDQMQALLLPGTDNARNPFFSPDGQWIAFFADGKLKKISAQGGAAVTLCDVPSDRGGSWGEDGAIIFSGNVRTTLSRVSSAGGTPEPVTTMDEKKGEDTHRWPQVLPGGKAVLFTAGSAATGFDDAEIDVYSMDSGKRKTILRGGSYARYLPAGYLMYINAGTLFAVPFDLKRLEATGQSAPIVEGVASNPDVGGAQFSVSDSGTLVYVAGSVLSQDVSIYWMDAAGKFSPLRETPANYNNIAISPDGKRLAMDITNGSRSDIWVYEWERDTLTRLTFAAFSNDYPVWTPDGQRIVYGSAEKGGVPNLWWIRADGGGDAQRLSENKNIQVPGSWSPDGKTLAFFQSNPGTGFDVMTMSMEGNEKSGWKPGEPKPFANTPFVEVLPAFSPDGRWIAYTSNESGNFEVYVRPFPGPGGRWQISTGTGALPIWSKNGKELLYRAQDGKIMVVKYTSSGDTFHAEKPNVWSSGQFSDRPQVWNYSLSPDGKRFAVLKAGSTDTAAAPINKVSFIFNFFDELKRKVPGGKN